MHSQNIRQMRIGVEYRPNESQRTVAMDVTGPPSIIPFVATIAPLDRI